MGERPSEFNPEKSPEAEPSDDTLFQFITELNIRQAVKEGLKAEFNDDPWIKRQLKTVYQTQDKRLRISLARTMAKEYENRSNIDISLRRSAEKSLPKDSHE